LHSSFLVVQRIQQEGGSGGLDAVSGVDEQKNSLIFLFESCEDCEVFTFQRAIQNSLLLVQFALAFLQNSLNTLLFNFWVETPTNTLQKQTRARLQNKL